MWRSLLFVVTTSGSVVDVLRYFLSTRDANPTRPPPSDQYLAYGENLARSPRRLASTILKAATLHEPTTSLSHTYVKTRMYYWSQITSVECGDFFLLLLLYSWEKGLCVLFWSSHSGFSSLAPPLKPNASERDRHELPSTITQQDQLCLSCTKLCVVTS